MRTMVLYLWSVRLQNENKYLGNLDKLQSQNHKILPPLANKNLSLSQGVCVCESRSVVSASLRSHGLYSPWNSPGQNTGMGSLSLLQGIFPTQGWKPRSPTLQGDSLPAEPQGKPKKTGVGNLSLFQQIFLTQELYQGLLHCRWILYQLIYEGSPKLECQFQ